MSCLWLVLLACNACGGPLAKVDLAAPGAGAQQGAEPTVLLVTLTGKLGTTEIARCHRTLRQAAARGCRVVFRLQDAGAFGEDAGDVQSLLDAVQSQRVECIAVLSGRVTQGPAALALCCDKTYCLKNASWGEVEKPEAELGELFAAAPDSALAARFDGARQAMAGRLARRVHKLRPDAEKVALAMADPRVQLISATVREGGLERARILTLDEVKALQAAGGVLLGDEPMTRPLIVTAQQADDFGLSNGTLQSAEQLAEVLAIDPNTIGELTENWAESMVAWLELLSPFLLIAGFLLLLVEVKSPGVGLPGLLGCAFLGLAMFHSYLVGLAEVTEILLFFLGIAAIAAEIFLLPGTVVFGAIGFVLLVVALVLSRQSFVLPSNAIEEDLLLANLANLMLLFVIVIAAAVVVWRLLPKVPWTSRLFLQPPTPELATAGGGHSPRGIGGDALLALVGRVGTAATVLRPGGTMEIDGDRIDVVTEGDFVEAGTALRVLYVQGNRVVVAADARTGERGVVSMGVVLLLLIVGLVLLVAEVMLVSFGVIALMAGIALLSAVFVAFQHSIAFGATVVAVEAVLAPVVLTLAFKLLPKTPFGKAMILSGPPPKPTASESQAELASLLRQTGVALSPLRPAGHARIGGHKVDVTTRGEPIEANTPVVVLDVSGNRVVVAAVTTLPQPNRHN